MRKENDKMFWGYLDRDEDGEIIMPSESSSSSPENLKTVQDYYGFLSEIHGYEIALFLLYINVPNDLKQDAITFVKERIIEMENVKERVKGDKYKKIFELIDNLKTEKDKLNQ